MILYIIVALAINQFLPGCRQKNSAPDWIEGTWHNPFESNTNNFEFWTFSRDSIFFGKGLFGFEKGRSECLNVKYSGYVMATKSSDSIHQVSFIRGLDTIIYEFELCKKDDLKMPMVIYSIVKNGVIEREKYRSLNLVLSR